MAVEVEDEDKLLHFLILHHIDKGKPVIGLPSLSAPGTVAVYRMKVASLECSSSLKFPV
jgi:hypothetical protein